MSVEEALAWANINTLLIMAAAEVERIIEKLGASDAGE